MGVGYQTSPLHRILYLEHVEGPRTNPPPDVLLPLGAKWDGRPTNFVSPTVAEIIQWRSALSTKYGKQLGEPLTWHEESDFEYGADVATSADMLLRYVAAVLDQQGIAALRPLAGTAKPSAAILSAVFAKTEQLKFRSRFPHLLLGVRYWLPYDQNLIMEEPSWRGTVERFGSIFRLKEEIKAVRDAILDADPSVSAWTAEERTPEHDIVAAAWQASDTISRLCAMAIDQRLPLWTTG